eukprot:13528726-Ditylum_brightwellii.AAC.1
MAHDKCSILGCIPATLLTEYSSTSKLASIHSHTRTQLLNSSCATSTDSRGLAIDNDIGEMGLRGKGDSVLLESVGNKQM